MNSLNQNPHRHELTIKHITRMQNKILGEMKHLNRLPPNDAQRKDYIRSILIQQRSAGIITKTNKLTKAFGG